MSRHKEFMRSAEWREVKRQRREMAGNCCEACGRRGRLAGHHLRYPSDPYACTVDDIQMLCEPCHNKLHADKSKEKRRRDHAGEELAKLRARQQEAHECFEVVGRHRSNR